MIRSSQPPPHDIQQTLAEELEAWWKHRPEGAGSGETDTGTVYERLHRAKPAALCLSGGGIRSATFGLGVLQGLARKGLLKEFDFISTVSGGGYIGSWLSSWIAREARSTGGDWNAASTSVFKKLAEGDREHPYPAEGEQPEIAHLRSYSNYLTPKLGLMSVDSWTLAATWLRNVIVNWFVLLPFFLGALALPRIWSSALSAASGEVVAITTALSIAGVCGLFLVVYLAFARPLPDGDLSAARHTWRNRRLLFAVLGPGMLVVQALSMCYVRAAQIEGTGPTSGWWDATWGQTSALPFSAPIAGFVKWLSDVLAMSDSHLLISLTLSVLLLNHIGWAIYTIRVKRAAAGKPVFQRAAVEFIAATVAAISTGWFLWLIIIKLFADPMRGISALPLNASALNVEFFAVFAPALYLLAFFVQTMIFVGLTGKINEDQDREWWARWAGWLLIISVASMVIAAIAIFGPLLIAKIPKTIAALGGITGVITLALGRSGASPGTETQKIEKGLKATLSNLTLALAAPIFVVIIFSALSSLNTWLLHTALNVPGISAEEAALINPKGSLEPLAIAHFAVLRRTPFLLIVAYVAALFTISFASSVFVQVNRFSMHGLYRNRLTRAYLGASNAARRPDEFTGFDEADNVYLQDLPHRPLHVVNVALNLGGGRENLAWQERKAASFTFSPLHNGSSVLGYRPWQEYTRPNSDDRGITLGTAMAISGAAVSPNMGYHTSPAMSLLLTLFNVRLGWWLGNPATPLFRSSGPWSSLLTILKEAIAKTSKKSWWVYLSDGGHFENLGLYEMVRRRCHTIVVSDAGRDPAITCEDLGNAIRKIRIDLGIPITIDDMKIFPRENKKPGRYFATGTIHYDVVDPGAPPGVLIYLKPCIYGKEPVDIRNYASQNLEFPHESTSDQWFTESQFESYRALGAHVIDEICMGAPVKDLDDLAGRLQSQLEKKTKEPLITDGLRKPPQTPSPDGWTAVRVPGQIER